MRDQCPSDVILHWYDQNARQLPWRVGPAVRKAGKRPDPYAVWLSEIMLQQTTVATVGTYFNRFTDLWPTVGDLAGAADEAVMAEWAGLGYYARARNLIKCARIVAFDCQGKFPSTPEALQKLPGIGPYTSAAIAAIAFDHPATVVDGNVERVIARLFAVDRPLPGAKKELTKLAVGLSPKNRPGDYAQAVMDLGATVCKPKSPNCGICPWADPCKARSLNIMNDLPRRLPKTPKPTRFGIAYFARRGDGAFLMERRANTGLLGGMLGWPGSDWGDDPVAVPPIDADWRELPGKVRHTFTHFHLRLTICVAKLPDNGVPTMGFFIKPTEFRRTDLPTVMRKVFDLAHDELAED